MYTYIHVCIYKHIIYKYICNRIEIDSEKLHTLELKCVSMCDGGWEFGWLGGKVRFGFISINAPIRHEIKSFTLKYNKVV